MNTSVSVKQAARLWGVFVYELAEELYPAAPLADAFAAARGKLLLDGMSQEVRR